MSTKSNPTLLRVLLSRVEDAYEQIAGDDVERRERLFRAFIEECVTSRDGAEFAAMFVAWGIDEIVVGEYWRRLDETTLRQLARQAKLPELDQGADEDEGDDVPHTDTADNEPVGELDYVDREVLKNKVRLHLDGKSDQYLTKFLAQLIHLAPDGSNEAGTGALLSELTAVLQKFPANILDGLIPALKAHISEESPAAAVESAA